MSQLTTSQEIIAKDIYGHEWSFKHTLSGDHSMFHFKICEYLLLIYIMFTNKQLGTPKNIFSHLVGMSLQKEKNWLL